jgi:hypothetical protein
MMASWTSSTMGTYGIGGCFFQFPFSHPWFFRLLGTALLVLMICRAGPNLVPKKKDLKKLFDGFSTNFWYSIEEDKYLRASTLGSDVVTIKNFIGATGLLYGDSWYRSIRRYVG